MEEIKENVDEVQKSAESSTPETFTKDQVQKLVDSEISKAVNKYKETTYRKDLEKGIAQALEDREKKTPEQLQIEKLQQELESERNIRLEKERAVLKDKNMKTAMELLASKNMPVELAEFVASEDDSKTTDSLNKIISALEGVVTKTKQSMIDGNNIKVPSKSTNDADNKPGPNASKAEWKNYYQKNR